MHKVHKIGGHALTAVNDESPTPGERECSTLDEFDGRRAKVVTLRLRGFTQEAMARALGVDQSTISRDMDWIRNHRKELFGDHPTFDSAQEIGEAVALFDDAEKSALRDYSKLTSDQAGTKNAYLRTVVMARQARVDLFRDLGFFDRQIKAPNVTLRAEVIRQMLIDNGLLITDQESHGLGDLARDESDL